MKVDFNEDEWLRCIPFCSLNVATLVFAAIGVTIGLAISLTGPQTETVSVIETITTFHNISASEVGTRSIRNIYKTEIVHGEAVYFYSESRNVSNSSQIPVVQLGDPWDAILEFPGRLWLNALKLLVLPLIILMMVILPSRVDSIGQIGKMALPLYVFTSAMAALQGTFWAWTIRPGDIGQTANVLENEDSVDELTITEVILNVFYGAIPSNIVGAMSDFSILAVIVFFLSLGVLLKSPRIPERESSAMLLCCRALLRCMMRAIMGVIWFTPIAMASMIAVSIASTPDLVDLMKALGLYVLSVVIGHGIHVGVFYPMLYLATTRQNGWKWLIKIREVPLFAFMVDSSAATLPRSLQVAGKLGVRKDVYQFILPLGCAINMDGTALGFPIMIALIAQINGVEQSVAQIAVTMALSVVMSIGSAPVAGAGMVYLTVLLDAAGLGEYSQQALATLYVVDWIVNRIEVAVNVTSDQMVARIIDIVTSNADKKNNHWNICGCCVGGKAEVSDVANTDFPETQQQSPV